MITTGEDNDPGAGKISLGGKSKNFKRIVPYLGITLIVVILLGVIGYALPHEEDNRTSLDPQAWNKSGSHALAELLRQQGYNVRIARNLSQAESWTHKNTVLVITNASMLENEEALKVVARFPGDRVLLDSSPQQLSFLAPGVHMSPQSVLEQNLRPECDWSGAIKAGEIYMGGTVFTTSLPSQSCYSGTLLRYRSEQRMISLLSGEGLMNNENLDTPGVAALLINLIGTQHDIVWLAPLVTQNPQEGGGKSINERAMDALRWPGLTLVVAIGLLAAWQGRRMGPVVVERLPATVRASETTEGMGRLLRERKAWELTITSLRGATIARIARRLALPIEARDALIENIAVRTSQERTVIREVLFGNKPTSDVELMSVARQLQEIERTLDQGVPLGKREGQ